MILVTGATGKIGTGLVAELKQRGAATRALTRDPDSAARLENEDVEAVVGDLANRSDVDAAVDGVEAVFLLTSQHPDQAEWQNSVVESAEKAGVKRIVKLSAGSGVVGEDSLSWAGRAHWQTEEKLRASKVGYTLLRPNWFMQNLLAFAAPIKDGKLPMPFGDAPIAAIDVRDISQAAAVILTEDGAHDGQTYDLTGPEAITPAELAERLGKVLGHEVRYLNPPIDAAMENMRKAGAPDWFQQHMREVATLFQAGAGADQNDTTERLLGQKPRSIEDFARDHAQAFV